MDILHNQEKWMHDLKIIVGSTNFLILMQIWECLCTLLIENAIYADGMVCIKL